MREQASCVLELGTPGEMRRTLTDLTLAGTQEAPAGLLEFDYHAENEPLEHVGERLALLDDSGDKAELEVVDVQLVPFAEVTWGSPRQRAKLPLP